MEKQLKDEENKLKLATEQLERNELDFMVDLQKLETKLIDQEKTPKPKTTTTGSPSKTDPKASQTTKTSTVSADQDLSDSLLTPRQTFDAKLKSQDLNDMIADQKVIMTVPKAQRVSKNIPREKQKVVIQKEKPQEKPKIEEEKKQPVVDPAVQLAALEKTVFGDVTKTVQK